MEALASELLDTIFGAESTGATSEERARTSVRMFVRSQDHLAPYSEGATGHRLSASETLAAFGVQKLAEMVEFGSAILPPSPEEPAATLRQRRTALGLTTHMVASRAGVQESDVERAEQVATRSPISVLERIAAAMGLDERVIAAEPGSGGDRRLAARLRTLSTGRLSFSQNVVVTFAEAAWVIRTQIRLARAVSDAAGLGFEPDSNYGDAQYPAWSHGYFLARKARQILGLNEREPIPSLRQLCVRLRIPIILTTLPKQFAGATVESGSGRGILLNTVGRNENVWVRRATLAHELGHMFWDSSERLETVRVDEYDDIDLQTGTSQDFVEARANAFAIEFLAPAAGLEDVFARAQNPTASLHRVMEEYGISFTAARNHIWNSIDKKMEFKISRDFDANPASHWQATESYTDDYFPLKTTSQLRRGEFAGVVVAAERARLISVDTASSYLQCDRGEYEAAADTIQNLFEAPGAIKTKAMTTF
jgi:Zn-dependent peptidase ImmA (M78 family)